MSTSIDVSLPTARVPNYDGGTERDGIAASSLIDEATALISSTDTSAGVGNVQKTKVFGATTWWTECVIIVGYAIPLICIALLELSLTLIPVFMSGHLGSGDLAAVSLAMMTAHFTGYSVYRGLATSLDTMCAQAFGSGQPDLVGLYVQRMVLCLLVATIPIAFVWVFSTPILTALVPDAALAAAAGRYLRILIFGAPGFACFLGGRRYTQAQGKYRAIACTLILAAPANGVLSYYLVWVRGLGLEGLATSLASTQLLLPVLLAGFTAVFYGYEHWPQPSRRLLRNWSAMLRLSVPGLIMIMCDTIAFEALSLASAQMGTEHLAANMILMAITNLAFRFPTGIAIASGTRVAHLVGADWLDAVKVAMRVAYGVATCIGLLNGLIIILFRSSIVALYTKDTRVAHFAEETCKVIGMVQMVDTAVAQSDHLLYGLGRQRFGAVVSTVAYITVGHICCVVLTFAENYQIGLPASLGMGFGLHWGLDGLWGGLFLAMLTTTVINISYLSRINVEAVIADSSMRLDGEDVTAGLPPHA